MRKKMSTDQGKVTRCTYDDVLEPRTPEPGHTPLIPTDKYGVVVT